MTDEQPDRRRRRVILACCSLSLFIVSLDATIVNVGLPSIQRDLHTDVAGLQWVLDAYLLVLASLLLLSGSLGDRFGRRRMFRIGLVTFGAGSLLCSLAPNVELLVASRMLQAAGGSMLNPNTLSIISNVFTDGRERAQAIGIWGGVFGVSAASGPILGGILVEAIGWRSLFWINVPVVVTALVLATRFVPESRAERPRRLDPAGQALAIILLASLSYAIIEGPTRGWTSPLILALFAVAAAALPTLLVVERHRVQPLLEMRFFRSPPFAGAACIATLAFMVLTGFLFLNTLYLQEARGDSALVAGFSTLPATLVVVVVSPISGRITGRRGSRVPLTVAGIVMAGGSLVLAQVHSDSPFLMLAVAYLLLGL
ncbi:MAG: MFS transporter, partial [Acidimicrobiales bacterium]